MSHLDHLTLANKKNSVGKTRLNTELNRINREQLIEMRMHKNARQRFKNKYARMDGFNESKENEASDVIMYETHNPGFCYRRNGECRLQQSCITNSSVNIKDLHILLFTKGEIDIDKVLCLYLLTAHTCETLRTPPKSQCNSFLARQKSPVERLIDRSRRRKTEHNLLKLLPLYILTLPVTDRREQMKDQRLAGKIIINIKILQIVESVNNALEVSNPDLMQKFLSSAIDMNKIQMVLGKPKMHNFYKNLYGQNIISSCESFVLDSWHKDYVIPFEVDVDPLASLLYVIKQNVLLMPNSNTWKMYNMPMDKIKALVEHGKDLTKENKGTETNSSTIITEKCTSGGVCGPAHSSTSTITALIQVIRKEVNREEGSTAKKSLAHIPEDTSVSVKSKPGSARSWNKSEKSIINNDKKLDNIESQCTLYSDSGSTTKLEEDFSLHLEPDSCDIDIRETVAQHQPKIMKNLQLGFSEAQVEEGMQTLSKQDLLPLDALANLLSKKVRRESQAEYRNVIQDLTPPTFVDNESQGTSQGTKGSSTCTHGSYNLKQTTCVACLRRWRHPLPTPKISKIKKYLVPQLKDTSYFSSKSAQRISELINDKVKMFEQSEENESHPKEGVFSNRMYKQLAKGNYLQDNSIEIIDLDELELAKIRQEIRECETSKKLKEFLQMPL